MRRLRQLRYLLEASRSQGIARRYFVVNGFDGALTMLGLTSGFRFGGAEDLSVIISACLGAAVALGISGLTSAYLSESAERRLWLSGLQEAMVRDLSASALGTAARVVPWVIALVNSLAPLLVSLVIIAPLWLAHAGFALPLAPLSAAIASAFFCIFCLGLLLGQIAGTSWLWGGVKSVLIALATMLLIRLLEV